VPDPARFVPDESPADPPLLRRLSAEPDGLRIYADWLLERGEPRGELAGVAIDSPRARDLLALHADRWLGPAADRPWIATWCWGFVDALTYKGHGGSGSMHFRDSDPFPYDADVGLVGVAQRPALALLRRIVLEDTTIVEPPEAPLPSVRELVIGPWSAWMAPARWFARLPALRTLELIIGEHGIDWVQQLTGDRPALVEIVARRASPEQLARLGETFAGVVVRPG
jgi:hypothetical protein